MLLDVAHTTQSMLGLVTTAKSLLSPGQQVVLVFGATQGKPVSQMIDALLALPLRCAHCVEADAFGAHLRSVPPEDLARLLRQRSAAAAPAEPDAAEGGSADARGGELECHVYPSGAGRNATEAALKALWAQGSSAGGSEGTGGTEPLVVVTGSTYVVANALQHMQSTF